MSDETANPSLEERRLALEERKWREELEMRKAEMQAKAQENSWSAKLFSPLTATLLAGMVTIVGSVTATLMQNNATLNLEQEKFESSRKLEAQKEQHELILKMISVDNVEQAQRNVRFLAETQLITDAALAARLLAAKETPLIKPATVTQSAVPPPLTVDDVRRLVSEDAINMMIAAEIGGGREVYKKQPQMVGDIGGVVIGIGYDLGFVTLDKFKDDWSPYLSQPDLDRLAAAVGSRGEKAQAAMAQVGQIEIEWDDAVAVFYRTLPFWAMALERNLPNMRELPPVAYGALLSLVYNRGVSFKGTGDRFSEMREIAAAMARKDYAAIPKQLRAMKRLWPTLPKLVERRESEAKLFEQGLAILTPEARR